MRIAFTHPNAGGVGGVERHAHTLAVRLLDAGHEVHFFCQRARDLDSRIRVHHVVKAPRLSGALRVLAFDVASEGAVRRAGPFDIVQGFGKTSRQDVYFDGSGCLADYQRYSIDTRRPAWQRALRRWSPQQLMVARIEGRRFRAPNYRRIAAISRLVRAQIIARHGVPERDIEVVYPGVDLERFTLNRADEARPQVRARLGLPADAPLVVFLGSDYARKGLGTLLRALPRLPDAHALVIGRERHESAYRGLAEKLGVADRAHFLGVQPEPERWLAAGDCLAFPSHFDAFGLVVLEALACGLPAVVCRRSGAAELVEPGRSGAVFDDPEDDAALAAGLRPFLAPGERAATAAAARKSAERYDWGRHTAELLRIYAEVIEERRRGR